MTILQKQRGTDMASLGELRRAYAKGRKDRQVSVTPDPVVLNEFGRYDREIEEAYFEGWHFMDRELRERAEREKVERAKRKPR